jgi:glycosyltransferase involved in cell wall biosynthesis
MKLSIYTGVKDGIYYDYHVVDMIKHHIPLADEIVVNEGYSSDGTYEAIKDIHPKVNVVRSHWDRTDPSSWHRKFKNAAREMCTGDWCILLDADEFIADWEFDRLRRYLVMTDKALAYVSFKHFYGNYKVFMEHLGKMPPAQGVRIHRNQKDAEVWGDGANVRLQGQEYNDGILGVEMFECHHFGEVRDPARLRQKWRIQSRAHSARPTWDRLPSFLFNIMPHKWDDPSILPTLGLYEGPFIKAVQDNPEAFVRDEFMTYKLLSSRQYSR